MIAGSLKVMLWDKEIGRLSWDARRGGSYFEYNPALLGGELDPFPLVASVKSPASRRPIIGDKEARLYRKLPPFLADSLPDAWGDQVFECWRIQNGIRNQEITPLEILSFIGRRGMGALEFVPESSGIGKAERLNMKALTDLAQRIFTERENVRLMPEESLTMRSLMAVGTSAGGRQPKAIIAVNPETGEIRSGQIAGHRGFDYYILKFGDAERSSAELEMAYYKMANAAGIGMAPCRIVEVEGRKHFITLRFDRDKERKLSLNAMRSDDYNIKQCILDYAQNHEQFEINQLVLRQHTCTKQPLIYTPLIFKKILRYAKRRGAYKSTFSMQESPYAFLMSNHSYLEDNRSC